MLLALALCWGCSSSADLAVVSIEPAAGSARGGETVVVSGTGLDGVEVLFDGLPVPVTSRTAGAVEVTTPPHLAGAVDVTVRPPGEEGATLPAGYRYEPLDLHFIEAPAHYLPDLSVLDPSDAAATDFDGDGDVDILLAVRGAPSRLLANTGSGSFLDTAAPPDEPPEETEVEPPKLGLWSHDTAALVVADFDGDGSPDAFLCNRSGQPSRLALNDGAGGLAVDEGAFPDHAGNCLAAAAGDIDGDGRDDLIVAGKGAVSGGKSYVRVYRRSPDGLSFEPATELEPPADVDTEPVAVGKVEVSAPEVSASYTISADKAADGEHSGKVEYDLSVAPGAIALVHGVPKIYEVPDAVEVDVYGDGGGASLSIRIIDAEGETYLYSEGAIDWSNAKHIRAELDGDFTPSGGDEDGVLDLPIASIALIVGAEAAGPKGELYVDNLKLELPDTGLVWIEDFERRDFTLSWDGTLTSVAATDLDGDGRADVVLSAAGGSPLRLLSNHGEAGAEVRLDEALSGGLDAVTDAVSHVLPLDDDDDGVHDLLALTADQDRLLVNDGKAHFFDDTVAALPVDRANGRHALLADLDLDGKPDVLIANDGDANRLYIGRPQGFIDMTPSMPLRTDGTLRMIPLDADGDGDLDIFVLNKLGEPSFLYASALPPND